MPLVQTRGAASAQGFGEFAQAASGPVYIEDVFSTYIFVGTQTTTTITNGIDLSGKGGLVWLKDRTGAGNHTLGNTARSGNYLYSNNTDAESSVYPFAFTSTGFTLNGALLDAGRNFVTWTFRKQPKFFDIVTFTGTGSTLTVNHNLGSVPGMIIVKGTSVVSNWYVYHRSLGATKYLRLNATSASVTSSSFWNDTEPTSTTFTIGNNANINDPGQTYIAYLFAHDAGGFGLTGTDNVISCGSFTTDGSGNATVSLGYEPQWLLAKSTDLVDQWYLVDSMRGWPVTTASTKILAPNLSDAESTGTLGNPTATGFTFANGGATKTYIYIACRRGPMKVPTLGTDVFQPVTYSGNGSNDRLVNTTITPDLIIDMRRDNVMNKYFLDRLRGNNRLYSDLTNAESSNTAQFPANTFNVNQTGITVSADEVNASGRTFVIEAFRRAPSFFDEVCYTGTGSNRTVAHNLTVTPELMIFKVRGAITDSWQVYCSALDVSGNSYLLLNDTAVAQTNGSTRFTGAPTSTLINLATNGSINGSGNTYVAYLFATLAGISKVGSYTGNGTTQTINCGFGAGGARFVLIKRTNAVGDWYVYDTARGMTVLTDPYLWINSTNAEVATLGSVTTVSTGFALNSAITAAINVNGGNYIFLAIA